MAKKKTSTKMTAAQKRDKALVDKKAKVPKGLQNPATRRVAIHAMCRECIYDPAATGSWRKQVQECPSTGCPLWKFRPMQINAEIAQRAAAKKKRMAR